ncbi:TPA: hypothetical protein CPT95_03530 [Candidatus Gastranaerophilales bacterium HUM_15]|jgi:tetratricopeptide (TPR) repeat protein|nr:MAG TPA: hypothetical protein CPT95_03530 [Candidatus Gastranaerophilales bacterium HUM_15]DAR64253.1 MAG TPA: Tetratricopeptide repeat [Caudoviricetes sp.]
MINTSFSNNMKYICRNCGSMQYQIGRSGGCAQTFWQWCLGITVVIGLFFPIAFIVVAFEVLFLILTSRNPASNFCFKCKARGCVVPFNTPAGQQIYKNFYPEEYEEEEKQKNIEQSLKEEINEEIKNYSNKDWVYIIIPVIIVFLIIFILQGLIVYYSNNEPVKPEQREKRETSAQPETRQTLTKSECEKLYDTTLQDYSINKQAGKETEINDYYTKCAAFSPREKQSFLSYYYWGLAEKEKNQYNYEKAITYYHKALEANQKSTNINDKKGTMWLYHYLSECYFNTWQMEEAKKYALLTVQEKQRLGKSRVGLVDYERLGDICYNLKQYDEAENYYIKALQEIEYLRNLPLDVRNRMDLSDLDAKEEKFISILNGTFSQ